MKTSFQRKINYSKVFHCGRAEDFHRRCCCCSCCIFVVLVVEHFRILFVLPAILIFHLSESGSTFFYFLYFYFCCIVGRAFQLQATLDRPRPLLTLSAHFLASLFCLPAAFKCEKLSDEIHSLIFSPRSFLAAIALSFQPAVSLTEMACSLARLYFYLLLLKALSALKNLNVSLKQSCCLIFY